MCSTMIESARIRSSPGCASHPGSMPTSRMFLAPLMVTCFSLPLASLLIASTSTDVTELLILFSPNLSALTSPIDAISSSTPKPMTSLAQSGSRRFFVFFGPGTTGSSSS